MLWYAIRTHGVDGLRRRAAEARRVAAYADDAAAADIGWSAWRHPHAFTVVLKTPPEAVATGGGSPPAATLSHLICMPGVTEQQIDAFVADLAASGLSEDLGEWISRESDPR